MGSVPQVNPNIILAGQQPQSNPLDALARVMLIKTTQGQQQLQQQQIQEGALRLQQTKALNDAYRSALVVNPDGSNDIDTSRLTQSLAASGVAGSAIPSVLKGVTDYKKGLADLQDTQAKVAAAHADNGGALGSAVKAAGYDPNLFLALTQHGINQGAIDPKGATPYVQAVTQALQQDPSGARAKQLVEQLADTWIAQSPAQQKLITEATSAQGAAQRGRAAVGELALNQEKQTAARTDRAHLEAVGRLSANPPADQAGYAQFVQQQAPDVQQRLLATVPAAQYDPAKSPGMLNQAAMTPEQRFNASKPAPARNVTEADLAQQVAKGQAPGATPADVAAGNAADAALKRLDQSKIAARPNINVNMTPEQATSTAASIAVGTIDPATTRMMLRRQPGLMAEVLKVDPAFDEAQIDKRYAVGREFASSSNSKAGGQVIALNTLIHHADLYQQVGEALKNGSFKPGNMAYNAISSMMGSPAPQNAGLVARFLAGETAKVATGGIPAEGEVNGILQSLGTNASPDQIRGAGQTLLQIASGRMIPLSEKAKDAHLDGVYPIVGADAKEILTRRGYDPATMKPAAAQTAGATPATHTLNGRPIALNPKNNQQWLYTDAQGGVVK